MPIIKTRFQRIKTKSSQDLRQVPKTDWLNEIIGKSLKELVRLMYKVAISLTETSSKIYKLLTYNEAINNSINENK